jgi:glycosyltransferase involved in cell wall biosynthesis
MTLSRLRVLLVPDSIHWVTGTIAKNIARFNPWIEATVASGPVIDQVFAERPELMRNFDLVHFTCQYATQEWLPRFRDFVPVVTSHHHVSNWESLKQNLNGDAIVVGSPEWAEDLRARGADMSKVFCVPYGVDSTLFQPTDNVTRGQLRNKFGIRKQATVIGFFGKNSSNEYDRKGIDVFTKALRNLRGHIAELTVLLVGPGWQTLKDDLTSEGIKCIWIRFVPNLGELTKMYQVLDFYWVTARVEGGPVTLLEAMSTEVCCLTTSVGIAREIVRDGENALLLPFNDADAFAECTLALAAQPVERRRLGTNARVTILNHMHVGITARGIRAVYEKALENFRERRPGRPVIKLSQLADNITTIHPSSYNEAQVPLSGFPVFLHRRVTMLETLAWSEGLVYHGQRALAARLILKEWRQNPGSFLPARMLLRRFLPDRVVAGIVKVKNRSRVSAPLAASKTFD